MSNEPAAWTVHVRWLAWTPPWRQLWRTWWNNVLVPVELARRIEGAAPNFVSMAMGVAVSLALLMGVVVLAAADGLLAGVGLAVSVAGHLARRRPFLVEAVATNGQWCGWWVVGWGHARRVRQTISEGLAMSTAGYLDFGWQNLFSDLKGDLHRATPHR